MSGIRRPSVQQGDVVIERRRKQAAELYIRGLTQTEIGERLGVTQKTISLDLAAVREQWLASSLRDFDAAKSQELARIDFIESQAWSAWERSCRDAKTLYTESVGGRTDAQGRPLPELSKRARTVKGQSGDPRFLERVGWCVEQRCKILGLNAPAKHDVTVLTPEERQRKIAGILALLRDRSAAAGN